MDKRKWLARSIFLLIALSLFLPLLLGMWKYDEDNRCVQASRALFDVTSCDFTESTGMSLDGVWQFHWQQFLHGDAPMKKEPAYITVPSHWNNRYFFNTTYSTQGYATYRTEVRLPENMVGKPLAIRVSSARVARIGIRRTVPKAPPVQPV